jgi:hypothetical protein
MSATEKEARASRVHAFMSKGARREAEVRHRLAVELGRCQAMTAAVAAMLGAMSRPGYPEAKRQECLAGLAELLEGIAATAADALQSEAEA